MRTAWVLDVIAAVILLGRGLYWLTCFVLAAGAIICLTSAALLAAGVLVFGLPLL